MAAGAGTGRFVAYPAPAVVVRDEAVANHCQPVSLETVLLQNGILTINEVRSMIGLDGITGSDEVGGHWVTLPLQSGLQPSQGGRAAW